MGSREAGRSVRAYVLFYLYKSKPPTVYMMWAHGRLELPQTKRPTATQNKQGMLFGRVDRIEPRPRTAS